MIKFAFFIISLMQCINTNAQFKNKEILKIDKYAASINKQIGNESVINIFIDSIEVKIRTYSNFIFTENIFDKSGSILKINYYEKNQNLVKVEVSEPSLYVKEMFNLTDFYYKDNHVFFSNCRSTVQSCRLAYEDDNLAYYRYNPYLGEDFLKEYIYDLYERIKQGRSVK